MPVPPHKGGHAAADQGDRARQGDGGADCGAGWAGADPETSAGALGHAVRMAGSGKEMHVRGGATVY